MKTSTLSLILSVACLSTVAAPEASAAVARARLSSLNEAPSIVTTGTGSFQATVTANTISYELTYSAMDAAVTVAHIHVGQVGVNGGISVFLCSNLADPPAGTPACPLPGGTVKGTLTTASVVGPAAQNIGTGDFAKLLQAMRVGATYVNVHSADFAAGEIRGQIRLTAN